MNDITSQEVPEEVNEAEEQILAPDATEIPGVEEEADSSNVISIEGNVRTISVPNPTPEEMTELMQHVEVNHDFDVTVQPKKYNFKKSTDKDTGIITERNAVILPVPYPSVEGILTILKTGGKELELLQEAMEAVVDSRVRDLLYDDLELSAITFDPSQVSWKVISELPKAQRRGGGIPKETWEAFGKDYCAVMPEATGKSLEQIGKAVKLLLAKLAPAKTNDPVLKLLGEQLAIYAENSPNLEEYAECVAFLLDKIETFLNVSDEELLKDL